MKSVFQFLYAICAMTLLLASIIAFFPFVLLLSIPNKAAYRKIIFFIIRNWMRLYLTLIGMPVRVIGRWKAERHVVIVANHISYLDALAMLVAVPVYFRPLANKEMASIPLFGFIYAQIALLVDRSSRESRVKSMMLMRHNLRQQSSIAVFPEGSFNETEVLLKDFYEGAFRLAVQTGVPVVPMILPDTVRRWHYSAWWKMSPGRNRIFILDPVAPQEGETKESLSMRVRKVMEEKMIELKQ